MATTPPTNRASFTADEVLAVTGGVLVRRGKEGPAVGVGTDTRTLQPGNLFVALKGLNHDGHRHLQAAHEAGASLYLISSHVQIPGQASVIRVPDTLSALGKLAHVHRMRWARLARRDGLPGRLVAVTGSAGKTTTCRAVAAALRTVGLGSVHVPAGNLNNSVGIPLVLLGLDARHGYGVVEVGTNSPGEIAYGASLVEPDVAVLTLVACAHGEGLGSLEEIAWEKGYLLQAAAPDGAAIANADDPRSRAQLLRSRASDALTFGAASDADVRFVSRTGDGITAQRIGLQIRDGGVTRGTDIRTPLLGVAGAYATAAAVAVARALVGRTLDLEAVGQGFESVVLEEGRLQPYQLPSGLIIVNDAYNANPASMTASIQAASELALSLNRPLVLVLGEMRELGERSSLEHERVGEVARKSRAKRIVAVGAEAVCLTRPGPEGAADCFAPDAQSAVPLVAQGLGGDEVVLIKGSRAVGLDRIVRALAESAGGEGS